MTLQQHFYTPETLNLETAKTFITSLAQALSKINLSQNSESIREQALQDLLIEKIKEIGNLTAIKNSEISERLIFASIKAVLNIVKEKLSDDKKSFPLIAGQIINIQDITFDNRNSGRIRYFAKKKS